MTPKDVSAAAKAAFDAGLCVIPPREDGSKAPISEWKQYQTKRPDQVQLSAWYGSNRKHGVGVITGAVSHNLECLEFDDPLAYLAYKEAAGPAGLVPLVDRIEAGYMETTPGLGFHWFYYCEEVGGNTKLARRPKTPEEMKDPNDKVKVMIETRGEGGFVITAPSHGPVHPSSKPYILNSGDFSTITTITPSERAELFRLAKAMDMLTADRHVERRAEERTGRPGDDFNARADWEDILAPHGWVRVYSRGTTTYWRRPGKKDGVSATTNHAGSDLFYVFSSSSDFEAERGYSRFSVYTVLNHRGDHAAAAKKLASDGYGAPLASRASPRDEAAENAAARAPRTDVGDAELFVELFGDRVRYDHERAQFLIWRRHRWEVDRDGERYRMAVRAARTRQHAAIEMEGKDAEDLRKYGRGCESMAKQEAMLKALSHLEAVATAGSLWDMNPNLLGVANGVVDLTSGLLRPGKQEDHITLGTPIAYDPAARAPRWERYLEEIFDGDEEVIAFIQRAVGYSLTGSTKEQVMLLCHGKGSNGKSIFLTVLRALGGEYATNIASDTIKKKRGGPENHPAEIAVLVGKRVVTCSETPEAASINDERVKALVGGDTQTARLMRGNPFDFKPQLKLWLATNHLPKVEDDSEGFWRRMRLVPFERQFRGADRDNDLEDKLLAEMPGILAWAVRGAVEWFAKGLQAPQKVMLATLEYRMSSDPLADFISERCILGPEQRVGSGELYKGYLTWCEAQGIRSVEALNNIAFARRIAENYKPGKGSHGARLYFGLRLRYPDDPDPAPGGGYEDIRHPDLNSKSAEVADSPDFRTQSSSNDPSRAIAKIDIYPPPATRAPRIEHCLCYTRHSGDDPACPGADWWPDATGSDSWHCSSCHPQPE